MGNNSAVDKLLEYLKVATSPYHVVEEGMKKLTEAGFHELKMKDRWILTKGGKYFIRPFGTELFAFCVGEEWEDGQSLRIAAAHTDQPGFHIKPSPEMVSGNYLKLDTEVYGGPILNTWMDRPLSIAGKVALRSEDPFVPVTKLVDMKKPVLTIPNLSIHMNREVNKGVELNRQTDMIPLISMFQKEWSKEQYFVTYLAKELDSKPEDILDYDLFLYNTEEGSYVGMEEDFISAPRLDNLTSVLALIHGITEGTRKKGINLIALYDNEEIGSRSKQGADSSLLNMILERIYYGLGVEQRMGFYEGMDESILLSVDVAQAVHPNHPEKYDPNNQPYLNGGIIFKIDSNQRYAYDTEALGVVQQLCDKTGVKCQKFVNRSDVPGGGTLGSILSAWLPIKTVDLGVPLLAMHSAREIMGAEDQEHLDKLIKGFFQM